MICRYLRQEQLVVCGQLTDQCVESAVRDAADLGYLVTVVEDACGANSENNHIKGLHGMKGFARVISTQQVLQEIRGAELTGGNDQWPVAINPSKDITSLAKSNIDSFAIPLSSNFDVNEGNSYSYQVAILRSLRAAGVKFIR